MLTSADTVRRYDACVPIANGEEFVASIPQERRLLDQALALRDGRPAAPFTITCALPLLQPADVPALRTALDAALARHASLRTFFKLSADDADQTARLERYAHDAWFRPGVCRQIVCRDCAVPLAVQNLDDRAPRPTEGELQQLIDASADRAFAPDALPRLRATLARRGRLGDVLILTVDHMACDGLSLEILRRDLAAFYRAALTNQHSALPPIETSFHEFACWQHDQLTSGGWRAAARYWREQWSANEGAQVSYRDIPGAHAVAWMPRRIAASAALAVDADLHRAALQLAKRRHVTTYILWLAILAVVLNRRTAKRRAAIWGKFSNRMHAGVEHAVGWYASSHLLGIETPPDRTFAALLSDVCDVVCGAIDHQEMPFALLTHVLRRLVLFSDVRVTFDLIRDGAAEPGAPLGVASRDLGERSGDEALEFSIVERASTSTIGVRFPRDRFDDPTMHGLLSEVRSALVQCLRDPDVSLGRLRPSLE